MRVQKKNSNFAVLFCYAIVRINGGEGANRAVCTILSKPMFVVISVMWI